MSKRLEYQVAFATGKLVNIGCGEDPCGFGDRATHVDLDVYNHPNFVQADAHHLPFDDQTFDTAILGDMLEHCPDPAQVLREAARVAKKLVATIYEEWRLPTEGCNLGVEKAEMYDKGLAEMGFSNLWDYFQSLPRHKECIVSITPDEGLSHHPHIQQFTQEGLEQIIEDAGLDVMIFSKFQEGEQEGRPTFNWLLVAHRKE